MIDASGNRKSDLNIFSLIQKNKKGLVVFVNKWDLVEEKDSKLVKEYENAIRRRLAPFTDFPIVFGSALNKQILLIVMNAAYVVYRNRKHNIPTAKLNEVLLPIIEKTPPPSNKRKHIKITHITIVLQHPNTVVCVCSNLPQWIKEPYNDLLKIK